MLASSSLALALLWAAGAAMASKTPPQKADCYSRRRTTAGEDDSSLYQFEFPEIVGNDTVNLEEYRGHVLLLVNVATY